MAVVCWLLLALLAVCFVVLYKLVCSLRLLQSHGIKCLPPLPLLGNSWTRYKLGYMQFHKHLRKQHGAVSGFYLGHMPFLAVSDERILKHIMLKQFDSFSDRPLLALTRKGCEPRGLLSARGQEWKSGRHTLSPSFSAAKLRGMVPLVERSVETLLELFNKEAESGQSVDVCRLFGNYAMETILGMAFGQRVEVQRGENDDIVTGARKIFQNSDEHKSTFIILFVLPLMYMFPWLEAILRLLISRTQFVRYSKTIYSVAKQLVRQRRENPSPHKCKDMLQLMIDARTDKQEMLSDDQIVAHSATFLLAGYETTSTALSYVTYLLALHPPVQSSLQQHIDNYFHSNPDASLYDAAQDIKYLEKVILETLRLHCPVGSLWRYCCKDVEIEGVTIPKGVVVDIPVYLLHQDPQYWPRPEDFDPDRFSAEEKAKRPPLSYIPFGYGPRSCIGMRFAMLEAKLALIKLLRLYSFTQCKDTQVPLDVSMGMSVAPKQGIFLTIQKRTLTH